MLDVKQTSSEISFHAVFQVISAYFIDQRQIEKNFYCFQLAGYMGENTLLS